MLDLLSSKCAWDELIFQRGGDSVWVGESGLGDGDSELRAVLIPTQKDFALENSHLHLLSELVIVEGYSDWIRLLAEFTLKSLQSWQIFTASDNMIITNGWASSSVYYLLGLCVTSVHLACLMSLCPRLVKATPQDDLSENPLDNVVLLQDQLDCFPYLCRFQERAQHQISDKNALSVIEAKLAWIVHIVTAILKIKQCIAGIQINTDSQEAIDAELSARVLRIINGTGIVSFMPDYLSCLDLIIGVKCDCRKNCNEPEVLHRDSSNDDHSASSDPPPSDTQDPDLDVPIALRKALSNSNLLRIHYYRYAFIVNIAAVTTPLLKFMAEFVLNKAQRLTFDSSSPNGILLFQEVSKLLVAYGTRILSFPNTADIYAFKYKGIWIALTVLSRAILKNGLRNFKCRTFMGIWLDDDDDDATLKWNMRWSFPDDG
ncbi:hypothetical protein L6452_30723 [Arctium lappa]|uniref:Uncharacterized protein n=1 Tax=Arctium lappa TaxID=4217 RepID=A0ACB8ZJ56_ARCLA|nr:hypothetical protein L6452_30723 [Arctium lappa]